MEPDKISAEISSLSLTQKLILAQDIWDSIALESGKLPMPEWQKNELEKRYGQYKQSNMELHDWVEVHNELRERHKYK
ncbi:MAG: addiction module protein [Deltaproteobacteria bacterium]|jgi:putative addiction module component (TIGR02574 family)|nr:addiction module protein [Deltaproteobacteria bacterium]MDL1978619.1 addiction module protein [Deltaproteobacteria bacterium]